MSWRASVTRVVDPRWDVNCLPCDHCFCRKRVSILDDRRSACDESPVASEQGPFYRALGDRIRQVRTGVKLSQDSLARAVGLSRTSITNIEKGRQPVQVHLLVKIADALGATSASLLPAQPKDARRVSGEALRKLPAESKRWVEKVLSTTAEPTRDES